MNLFRQAWHIGKDFFLSKEYRKKAYFLLIASIIFQLGMVYSSVLMNKWSNDFYTALQELDKQEVYRALKTFVIVLFFTIFVFVSKYVCQAKLALNWRSFLTERYCSKWLNGKSYFGATLISNKNDNPDQRISEDLSSYVTLTIDLAFGIFSSIVTLASFLTILWSLSGILKVTILNTEFEIAGYLVWSALIYSLIGTVITYIIGRDLSKVDYLQEKKEANFRFSMMRLRENSSSIALYNGEKYEKSVFLSSLEEVITNALSIIRINRNLGIWSNLFNNVSIIAPILISAPRFFAKEITLGGLMQIKNAFGEVQESLSFLAISFKTIANYRAVVERLVEFNLNIDNWEKVSNEKEIKIFEHDSNDLVLKNLDLYTPDDKTLFKNLNLTFSPGNQYLLTGKNGAGKTTLIEAISGLWIFGRGEILLPKNKQIFFIPQKVYMNIGSLLDVITYPKGKQLEKEKIVELLKELNLNNLIERLDNKENWASSLSFGEQQKIAIIRAILINPDILIMDESSSSLTRQDEELVYNVIKARLPKAIIISIGHREGLKKLHNHEIHLTNGENE